MSDKDNGQVSTIQRPTTDDPEAWKAYWNAQGWPWRTEPEIDVERQKYLDARRKITPDIEKGIYPFKDIKLGRADVEWLLADYENERWLVLKGSDKRQRERLTMKRHGSVIELLMREDEVEGENREDWDYSVNLQIQSQFLHLNLNGANLHAVNMKGLPLGRVQVTFTRSQKGVSDYEINIEWPTVTLVEADLTEVHLEETDLREIRFNGAILTRAHLERTNLSRSLFERANLRETHLEDANLLNTSFEGADLTEAHFEGANLTKARLVKATLCGAFFDRTTKLHDILLRDILDDDVISTASLADIHWGDVNISVVKWSNVFLLGDENSVLKLEQLEQAIRANRQLSVVLKEQGLYEDAARFAYRAQQLQRKHLWREYLLAAPLFSLLLDLLAGYGYRPGRSVLWYLAVIFGFALTYHFLGGLTLYPPDAFIFSIMSFHGRGFFPALSQETNLHNPLVMLAALEAIIGLLIEISFIATFTQRFFGR